MSPTIEFVIARLGTVLNRIIPFLLIVATAVFLWGIVRYLSAGGDQEQTLQARRHMVYGVIALAIMLAVWGFAFLLIDVVFDNPNPVPTIPGPDIINEF